MMVIGVILFSTLFIFILPLLLIKIVKLPTLLVEYDRRIKIFDISLWIIIALAIVEAMLLDVRHLSIIKNPIKFLIMIFTIVSPLICLMALKCACPKCHKLFIWYFIQHISPGEFDTGDVSFARDILKRKRCPRCNFTFKTEKAD